MPALRRLLVEEREAAGRAGERARAVRNDLGALAVDDEVSANKSIKIDGASTVGGGGLTLDRRCSEHAQHQQNKHEMLHEKSFLPLKRTGIIAGGVDAGSA